MIAEIFGWLGNVCIFFGVWKLARKAGIIGFISCSIGDIFYISKAIIEKSSSLFCLSLILTMIHIYGIYNWRSK